MKLSVSIQSVRKRKDPHISLIKNQRRLCNVKQYVYFPFRDDQGLLMLMRSWQQLTCDSIVFNLNGVLRLVSSNSLQVIRGTILYLNSTSGEVPIKKNISIPVFSWNRSHVQKSCFEIMPTPLLKKYGVLISELSSSCCEVYFDSQLIREDWISAFLRYSLLETVPCNVWPIFSVQVFTRVLLTMILFSRSFLICWVRVV